MNGKKYLKVEYKFKGDRKSSTVSLSEQQYLNLLALPIIAKCEIIGSANSVSEEEKNQFNERIKIACRNDTSHIHHLLN